MEKDTYLVDGTFALQVKDADLSALFQRVILRLAIERHAEKVLQRTPIPAMARARDALATRTDSRVLAVSFLDPTLVRLEHASKRYLAQIGQEVSVR